MLVHQRVATIASSHLHKKKHLSILPQTFKPLIVFSENVSLQIATHQNLLELDDNLISAEAQKMREKLIRIITSLVGDPYKRL